MGTRPHCPGGSATRAKELCKWTSALNSLRYLIERRKSNEHWLQKISGLKALATLNLSRAEDWPKGGVVEKNLRFSKILWTLVVKALEFLYYSQIDRRKFPTKWLPPVVDCLCRWHIACQNLFFWFNQLEIDPSWFNSGKANLRHGFFKEKIWFRILEKA